MVLQRPLSFGSTTVSDALSLGSTATSLLSGLDTSSLHFDSSGVPMRRTGTAVGSRRLQRGTTIASRLSIGSSGGGGSGAAPTGTVSAGSTPIGAFVPSPLSSTRTHGDMSGLRTARRSIVTAGASIVAGGTGGDAPSPIVSGDFGQGLGGVGADRSESTGSEHGGIHGHAIGVRGGGAGGGSSGGGGEGHGDGGGIAARRRVTIAAASGGRAQSAIPGTRQGRLTLSSYNNKTVALAAAQQQQLAQRGSGADGGLLDDGVSGYSVDVRVPFSGGARGSAAAAGGSSGGSGYGDGGGTPAVVPMPIRTSVSFRLAKR